MHFLKPLWIYKTTVLELRQSCSGFFLAPSNGENRSWQMCFYSQKGKKTISGHTWQTGPRNYKAEKRWEKILWKLQFMSRTPASRKPLLIFYNLTVVLELHITRRASFTSATRKTQPVSHPNAGTAKSIFLFFPKADWPFLIIFYLQTDALEAFWAKGTAANRFFWLVCFLFKRATTLYFCNLFIQRIVWGFCAKNPILQLFPFFFSALSGASENVYSMIQHPKDNARPESAVPGANGNMPSPRPSSGIPVQGMRAASPPCLIQRQVKSPNNNTLSLQ